VGASGISGSERVDWSEKRNMSDNLEHERRSKERPDQERKQKLPL